MRPILINATKRGTMMNELVVGDFLGQAVSAPSLAEQSRIGALFQKLDSLITLHQREGSSTGLYSPWRRGGCFAARFRP